ncbi:hypothetical protein E4P24_02105 [Haloferax sp. AS1]|uniref:hypothetical protein n=1 Tax=Haloferax sp. AS1 TaxID=2562277 RepID=UPI00165F877E|nr:hypothetical protein [Haloferax sp. AS1]MBC9985166.1 hypothetical protein [Haloferax sp. AS1]
MQISVSDSLSAITSTDNVWIAAIAAATFIIVAILLIRSQSQTVKLVFQRLNTILKAVTILGYAALAFGFSAIWVDGQMAFIVALIVTALLSQKGLIFLHSQIEDARE